MTTHAAPVPEERKSWHAWTLIAILVAIGVVGALAPSWVSRTDPSFEHIRLASWLVLFGLLLGFAVVIGITVKSDWRGVLIDERNRMSTSRLQMLLWTGLVLSAYLAIVLANVGEGATFPLVVSVPRALWWAMGVSTFSFVAAPFALKRANDQDGGVGKLHTNKPSDKARWSDLVTGELDGLQNTIDFAKLQMILVTIVLILGYGVVLGYSLDNRPIGIHALPRVSDAFAAFLAISHGAYLAKKRAPKLGNPKG